MKRLVTLLNLLAACAKTEAPPPAGGGSVVPKPVVDLEMQALGKIQL